MNQATHAEIECGTNVPPNPILPSWIFNRPTTETLEDAGFQSGATLTLLHVVLYDPITNVPAELLRNRLALKTAINCLKIEGRVHTEAEIRDAFYLTASGDAMGPAGDMLKLWRSGAAISIRHAGWRERLSALLPPDMQEQFRNWLEQAEDMPGTPVAKAASLLGNMVQMFPKQEAFALLCADALLARSLGWSAPLPLFGLHLKRDALRSAASDKVTDGEDFGIACHEAVARASQDAVRLAHDLARRADRLRAIAPKLRSKGSDEAVSLFLSDDAVLPSTMLSPTIRGSSTTMTPRSARRFCERLIELGVARELTGRAAFRLYGVA